jgi:hypothetical protein
MAAMTKEIVIGVLLLALMMLALQCLATDPGRCVVERMRQEARGYVLLHPCNEVNHVD